MKKVTSLFVLIVLIVLTVLAWSGALRNRENDKKAYAEYLDKAKKYESREIWVDALDNYKNALDYDKNNLEILSKIALMYQKLGDGNGFLNTNAQIIRLAPKSPEPYLERANYYVEKSKYADAIKTLRDAEKQIKDNEEIEELKKRLSTLTVEKYVSFSSVNDWHVQGDKNYLGAEENGKWGLVLKDGRRKVRFSFEYVGAFDKESGVAPCCLDGEYYYIDEKGNRRLVGDYDYQFLGSFGDGWAPAQRNEKYGYINRDFEEFSFEYDYSGSFANGVAAVQKNGKWALIDDKLNLISGFEYEDIKLDSLGFCSVFGMIVAKKQGQYYLLNLKGEKLIQTGYEDISLPASDTEAIAVKLGEVWGFVDTNGHEILKPQFQNAKSFSLGLAPVQVGDRWGFIDLEGNLVVECKYSDAGVFSVDGAAPVKGSETWNLLVLCEYDD